MQTENEKAVRDPMREAFEQALAKRPDARFWNTTDAMFWAWQAALQSQVSNTDGWVPRGSVMSFLEAGTRYKIASHKEGGAIFGLPKALAGCWVALVPADDDMHLLSAAPKAPKQVSNTPQDGCAPWIDLDEMVNRFLGWKLPEDFYPDAGVSFNPTDLQKSGVHPWPSGTNLLHAGQARAMLEYVLQGQPVEVLADMKAKAQEYERLLAEGHTPPQQQESGEAWAWANAFVMELIENHDWMGTGSVESGERDKKAALAKWAAILSDTPPPTPSESQAGTTQEAAALGAYLLRAGRGDQKILNIPVEDAHRIQADLGAQINAAVDVVRETERLALAGALERLVGLKDYKDAHGKDDYYEKEQPEAWQQARDVLNTLEEPDAPTASESQAANTQEKGMEAVAWVEMSDAVNVAKHKRIIAPNLNSLPVGAKLYLAPPTSTAIAAMVIKQAANICDRFDAEIKYPSECAAAIRNLTPANAEAELEALKYDACMKVAQAVNAYYLLADDLNPKEVNQDPIRAIVRRVLDEKGE